MFNILYFFLVLKKLPVSPACLWRLEIRLETDFLSACVRAADTDWVLIYFSLSFEFFKVMLSMFLCVCVRFVCVFSVCAAQRTSRSSGWLTGRHESHWSKRKTVVVFCQMMKIYTGRIKQTDAQQKEGAATEEKQAASRQRAGEMALARRIPLWLESFKYV